ncbi:MAG: glycerophosphodiester phosphodiesterase family protein [Bacilli bacterium]|nr:glycerophosphodiester phosphodiesterase family protein [Bacilli bacterium]
MNIIAHRGIHNEAIPENSMKAFSLALKKNIPIEFDVHILKDKNIVVFHDDNLKRMTNKDKFIKECTYEEIKNLKLKNTNEKIPLLKDVLKLVDGKVLLDIELKMDVTDHSLEDGLIEILKDYNGEVILKSFDFRKVKYLKKHTNYKIGLLIKRMSGFKDFIIRNINFNIMIKPDFLACNKNMLDCKSVKTFKKDIYIWTIKNKDELKIYKSDYYISENVF